MLVRIQKEETLLISDKVTQLVYRTIGGKQPLIAYCTYGDVNMSLDKKIKHITYINLTGLWASAFDRYC